MEIQFSSWGTNFMSNNSIIKAVIFDRDGVIIDTEGVHIESIKYGFKKLGYIVEKEDYPHIIGQNSVKVKEYFLSKWKFDYDLFRKIQNDYYYENLFKAKYFSKVVETIKSLNVKKVPLALTTSASREGTMQILTTAEIQNMFKVIVTKDDCEKFKPDPEPYLITSKKLKISPKLCVVIEDTCIGVISAKNAGMCCIALPNHYTKNQDFSMADYILESDSQLETLLGKILLKSK